MPSSAPRECLIGCGGSDLQCQADCYDDFDDGIDPLQDLLECSEVECSDVECSDVECPDVCG